MMRMNRHSEIDDLLSIQHGKPPKDLLALDVKIPHDGGVEVSNEEYRMKRSYHDLREYI